MIILDHVNCIYGQDTKYPVAALKDICLKIEDGSFIALIGHTGSGKSTLVQTLNGLIKPTSGNIYYNGEDIHDEDYPRKRLRSEVGLVFQYPEHQLFEETVFKDVCFGPKNLGLDDKEASLRAYKYLKQVGMDDEYFYQSPIDLSGGQKRRAAIAGVLAMEPKVLILDEPTAGLDPGSREDMLELLSSIHRENENTTILVSHSMEDAAKYADRIIVMDHGRVVMDGPPAKVFSESEPLEAIGLSVPETVKLMKYLKSEGIQVRDDVFCLEDALGELMTLFDRGQDS